MTVIATVISKDCIALASDSFLTEFDKGSGTFKVKEARQSKIVGYRNLRAAACYWGLARIPARWDTYKWLLRQQEKAKDFKNLEKFAIYLRDELDKSLAQLHLPKSPENGIGIHLAGYEYIEGYWIPELFVCSNFKDATYSSLCCLHVTRETFLTVCKMQRDEPFDVKQGSSPEERLGIHKWLHNGLGFLRYNNGDPHMFNPVATAIMQSVDSPNNRSRLSQPIGSQFYRLLAKESVDTVARIQRSFFDKGQRSVGGKIHSLTIEPNGEFSPNI